MKVTNTETKVVHSQSKPAWNVVGTKLGRKYKIARCPYVPSDTDELMHARESKEAFELATFISKCLRNAEEISRLM